MCTQANVFSCFSLRSLPYAVCAVLVFLELGLLKLIQRTSKYQKLDAWMSSYKKNYRQSTIALTEIQSLEIPAYDDAADGDDDDDDHPRISRPRHRLPVYSVQCGRLVSLSSLPEIQSFEISDPKNALL
jgi:hypothetical protein